MTIFTINNRKISCSSPTYIIAEAGVNHNGSFQMACKLISAAKQAGADCVKFQTFKAKEVAIRQAPKADYQLASTPASESQFEMLEKLELSESDFSSLLEFAREAEIDFLSTPYSMKDVDMLERIGVRAYKIASAQIIECDLVEYIATKGKPVIISTGLSDLAEVASAVNTIRSCGMSNIAVLQCTTEYPADLQDANLNCIPTMRDALDVCVGYSDHIESNIASFTAVALGARVIEKHFTLDRNLEGPDHKASLNPTQFAELVEGIRKVESSLGSSVKRPCESEKKNSSIMRRSIVAQSNITKGEPFSFSNLTCKRPGSGLHPKQLKTLIGQRASVDILEDQQIDYGMVEWKS